jgi:hypothetical protein
MSDQGQRFLPDQEHHSSGMRLRVSFVPLDDERVRIEFLGFVEELLPSPVVFLVSSEETAREISRNRTPEMVAMFIQLLKEACAQSPVPFLLKHSNQWLARLQKPSA